MSAEQALSSELEIVQAALADDYLVSGVLGRGGMATVYRARDLHLDRDVAIKVLPFNLVSDAELVGRFEREARMAAQLEHPHIVPIYRVGRSGQVIYFVMQYLRGEALSSRLSAHYTLPAHEIRRVLVETASALGHAHTRGIVHRDVKPDNIMLDAEGRCMVTDFGIARSTTDPRLTASGKSVGTPRYMSPEHARGKHVDGRSDIYSLGVVGYECLAGQVPFDGDDAIPILLDHVNTAVPMPANAARWTAEERALYRCIERMLAKDPRDRFQTTDELIDALGGSATHRAAPAHATPSLTRAAVQGGGRPATLMQRVRMSGRSAADAVDDTLRGALAWGYRATEHIAPRLKAAVGHASSSAAAASAATVTRTRPAAHSLRTLVARRPALVFGAASVVVAAVVGGWWAVHLATTHRSACPPLSTDAIAELERSELAGKPRPFNVLVERVAPRTTGKGLDVYYDVCGLPDGPFRTRLSIVKEPTAAEKLFRAAVPSITATFSETSEGRAERRHRTVDFADMPAGRYRLEIAVTDDGRRRRVRQSAFLVTDR